MPITKALERRHRAAMGAPVPEGSKDRILALQRLDEIEVERRAIGDCDAPPATAEQLLKGQGRRVRVSNTLTDVPKAGIAGFFSKLFGAWAAIDHR